MIASAKFVRLQLISRKQQNVRSLTLSSAGSVRQR